MVLLAFADLANQNIQVVEGGEVSGFGIAGGDLVLQNVTCGVGVGAAALHHGLVEESGRAHHLVLVAARLLLLVAVADNVEPLVGGAEVLAGDELVDGHGEELRGLASCGGRGGKECTVKSANLGDAMRQ